jgi:hypothetical protein
MLSRGAIGVLHWGQVDPGKRIDSPRGTRCTSTVKKDPKIKPARPKKGSRIAVMLEQGTPRVRHPTGGA